MKKFMLDTNIVIYVIKHRPPALRDVFNRHVGQMCISTITFAELMHGVEKSAAPERKIIGRLISDHKRETAAQGGLRPNNTATIAVLGC